MNINKLTNFNFWTICVYAILFLSPIVTPTIIGAIIFLVWLFKYRDISFNLDSAVGKLTIVLLFYFFVILFVTLLSGVDKRAFSSIFSFSQFLYLSLLLPFLATKVTNINFYLLGKLATVITFIVFFLSLIEYLFFFIEFENKYEISFPKGETKLLTGNANIFCNMFFPIVFLSATAWKDKSFNEKTLAIIAIVLGIITMYYFAGNRMSILASSVLLFIVCIYIYFIDRVFSLLLLGGLFLIAIFFIYKNQDYITMLWNYITLNIEAINMHSLKERAIMLKSAFNAFSDSPWIGYGAQNKFTALKPYLEGLTLKEASYHTPHNIIATHLLAGGILAFIAVISVILFPVYVTIKYCRNINIYFIAVVLTTSLLVLGISETVLFNDAKNTFYIILLFIFALLIDNTKNNNSLKD
jgi:O-antigen ligase